MTGTLGHSVLRLTSKHRKSTKIRHLFPFESYLNLDIFSLVYSFSTQFSEKEPWIYCRNFEYNLSDMKIYWIKKSYLYTWTLLTKIDVKYHSTSDKTGVFHARYCENRAYFLLAIKKIPHGEIFEAFFVWNYRISAFQRYQNLNGCI